MLALCQRLLSYTLDLLAPPECAACDASLTCRATFCPACGAPAPSGPRHLLADVPVIVAGGYAAPLSTAITRFKYGGRGELSRPLAALLLPALRELSLPPHATFVPVPLHARRLAERGYNQAGLVAQDLARALDRSCSPRLLARTRDTAHQVGKSRGDRMSNAQGAFALRRAARPDVEVVLVDDVITTGATVRACAQALADGGVKLLYVVALAEAREPAASQADGECARL